MKANPTKRKAAGNGAKYSLRFNASEHVFNVLEDFRKRYMPASCNSADAVCCLLMTALIDYERLMARCLQIENYCKAEDIEQEEYRESILRTKFPRGRVPRPKSAR